jgi:oligopeptide transport system substrate-binding protein
VRSPHSLGRLAAVFAVAPLAAATFLQAASPAAQAAARPAPAKPVYGGTLNLAMQTAPQTFDPARAGDGNSIQFARMQFNTLVWYTPLGVKIVPALAERWRVTDGGRTYTFTLRHGVTFSNGDPLTAQDVVFTFTRLNEAETAAPYQSSFADIAGSQALFKGKASTLSGIRAVGKYTVVMHLTAPEPYWLNIVALPSAGIEDARVAASWNADETAKVAKPITPVGTGPFILQGSAAAATSYSLVRNPHYWQKGLPYLGKIVVHIGASPTLAFEQFERGDIQFFLGGVDPSDYLQVKRPPLSREYYDVPSEGIWYLGFNVNVKPWNRLKLRQAVEYAIDKPYLSAVVDNSRAKVANTVLPPGMPGYEGNFDPYPTNYATAKGTAAAIAKAKALVKAAGYPHGLNAGTFYLFESAGDTQTAAIVKQDLARVGIRVAPRILSFPAFFALGSHPKGMGFYWLAWGQDYPDPQDFLYNLFDGQQDGANNFSWYNNATVNRLLARADTSSDEPLRLKLYDEVERMVLDQAVVVPLTFTYNDGLIAPNAYPKNPHYWASVATGSPIYAYLWTTR